MMQKYTAIRTHACKRNLWEEIKIFTILGILAFLIIEKHWNNLWFVLKHANKSTYFSYNLMPGNHQMQSNHYKEFTFSYTPVTYNPAAGEISEQNKRILHNYKLKMFPTVFKLIS